MFIIPSHFDVKDLFINLLNSQKTEIVREGTFREFTSKNKVLLLFDNSPLDKWATNGTVGAKTIRNYHQ